MAQLQSGDRITADEQKSFELLLADLSSRFINVLAQQVDNLIIDSQRRICESLGFDYSALWQWSMEDAGILQATHIFRAIEGPPVPERMTATEFFPWTFQKVRTGKTITHVSVETLPGEAARDLETYRYFGVKSASAFPLAASGSRVFGILGFGTLRACREWPDPLLQRLRLVAQVFSNALARKQLEEELEFDRKALKSSEARLNQALEEVQRLRDQLHEENLLLRQEVKALQRSMSIVGQSRAIRSALAQAEQVAATDATVLLQGETGTGKERFAAFIHNLSGRRSRTMVCVNCAAMPATLIESELFGREKGAYTGALSRQIGRFEMADHSTIFLDEIGDLPLDLQAKLLRVIEERQFERLGSPKPQSVDVRIIAATNQELEKAVGEGRFRQDLYFRLNVFPMVIPPLRERAEDIPLLVWAFVDEFAKSMGKTIESIPKSSMEALTQYLWPGNVRELRNVIERAMIVASGPTLRLDAPSVGASMTTQCLSMQDAEREHIRRVLDLTGWRVRGRNGAAELLEMNPSTLASRMAKLGIRRPGK